MKKISQLQTMTLNSRKLNLRLESIDSENFVGQITSDSNFNFSMRIKEEMRNGIEHVKCYKEV